jgi:hypothetical protein
MFGCVSKASDEMTIPDDLIALKKLRIKWHSLSLLRGIHQKLTTYIILNGERLFIP